MNGYGAYYIYYDYWELYTGYVYIYNIYNAINMYSVYIYIIQYNHTYTPLYVIWIIGINQHPTVIMNHLGLCEHGFMATK